MGPSSAMWSSPRVLRGGVVLLLVFNTTAVLWYFFGKRDTSATIQSYSAATGTQANHYTSGHEISLSSADKIAMIIETRMPENLVPLMLHFSNVLGPSWLVVLFTMENMYANFKPSPAFQRGIQGGRIAIRFMPPDTNLKKWKQVSRFLTRPWLWEQVRAASRVLMFQTDSIICSNSKHSMDDFLEWDFIGAPVNPFLGQGFNGGLSLRNPKMILDILASPDNDFEEMWKANKTGQYLEDQFYYNKMLARGDAKLPSQDIAQQFSVETVWSEWPLGYHAPRLWNADRMEEIWAYCPEVEMTSREKKVLFVDLTEDD